MKIQDYGLRLLVKKSDDSFYNGSSDLELGNRVSWLNIVRGLNTGKYWAFVKYHSHSLFCFIRKRNKIEIRSMPYGYAKHYMDLTNETLLFDIYKCARDNGITRIDIIQR